MSKTTKTKEDLILQILDSDPLKNDVDLMEELIDEPIAFDVDKAHGENLSFGARMADKITELAGSWGFIILFSIFLIFWMILNYYLADRAPDPYPFILLNLVLSCIASLQAPIIMMSQNRQAKKDSLRGKNDYKTDLKSELILEELHDKITTIEKNQKKIIEYLEKEKTN